MGADMSFPISRRRRVAYGAPRAVVPLRTPLTALVTAALVRPEFERPTPSSQTDVCHIPGDPRSPDAGLEWHL